MNERDVFLKALQANEDDTATRLVYADWLDEQGEHEEADRQRKWPAAKEWLVKLCRENNYPDTTEIWYEDLLSCGRTAVEEFVDMKETNDRMATEAPSDYVEDISEWQIGFGCGSNLRAPKRTP